MITLNGASLIVQLLERQGIRQVAGIPGGMNLPLYDALSQSRLIRHILTRHEQGAGFLAQGMARSTGVPAVCLATSGPGATNVLTALADAKLDSIPVICITGQVPTQLIGTDAFQEVDIFGMSLPITKHNFLVRSVGELLEVIPRAFSLALSGRPGPVLIDVPKDVQLQCLEFEAWPEPGHRVPVPKPSAIDLAAAADLINAAERPLWYLGGGVVHAGATETIRGLAENLDMPAVKSLMALGCLPAGHPLSLGLLGMHGARYANQALEECDLVIAAGSRFGDRTTGKVSHFCTQAKIVHLDIDESEIGKIKPADVSVVGDLTDTLSALAPRLVPRKRGAWLKRLAELKGSHPLYPGADFSTPAGIIRTLGKMLPPDAIIATDVGQHQMWVAQNYPHQRPRCWLTSSGLGTMGFGLPAALGAALANPGRTVVCFSGDGSLLMNIQELATLAEEGANVKIVLFDNQALGLVAQQQDLFFQGRFFASKFQHAVDFVQVARGFGIRAQSLSHSAHPEKTLEKALAEAGPCLIRIPVDVNEKVFPMVPPGAANRDMLEKKIPL
jgi:acetolactate synthase-1/2/3 large subunit